MSLYQFERRVPPKGEQSPIRWLLWWQTAQEKTKGLYLAYAVNMLLHEVWVVADITAGPSWKFFREIPGWVDPGDGYGSPLIVQELSPQKEYEAWLCAPKDMQARLAEHCLCLPTASKHTRKAAERVYQKTLMAKLKAAGIAHESR